jgi:site-specific DNA recombinase
MTAQAQVEGRFLGGRPPYGYQIVDAGPHPNPGKAADGKRLRRLDLDPVAAPIVARIFSEFLAGQGLFAIAEGLTADGIPSPAAHDPGRNSHRSGVAWAKGAVRAILLNPRYTGHQVWNKQRKDEVLIDVKDVAQGHTTKLRWNSEEEWVWSDAAVHPPIVTREEFAAAQQTLARRGGRQTGRRLKRVSHPYVLRSLLHCGVCERRMQGNWIKGAPYYRCRFPQEYALANKIMHPRNVYVREDVVVPKLDRLLARLFAPDMVDATLDMLVGAQGRDQVVEASLAAARRQIADSDRKLGRHRAALEAGADPAVVATWIAEEQATKAEAEARLRRVPEQGRHLGKDELAEVICRLGDLVKVLGDAEPTRKAKIYTKLGLVLVLYPEKNKVLVRASDQDQLGETRVSEGGLEPPCPEGH